MVSQKSISGVAKTSAYCDGDSRQTLKKNVWSRKKFPARLNDEDLTAYLGSSVEVTRYTLSQAWWVVVDCHKVPCNQSVYVSTELSRQSGSSFQSLYRTVPSRLPFPILTFECLIDLYTMSTDGSPSQGRNPGRHAVTGKLHGVLRDHYIGRFALPLRNIACAAVVREVIQGGVRRVAESVRAKNQLASAHPRIIVCKGALQSAAEADTRIYRILDGTHRSNAYREVVCLCGIFWC